MHFSNIKKKINIFRWKLELIKSEKEGKILNSLDECIMYPWYRDTQIGVGQFCGPVSATIKTESGFNDCMLTFDYAPSTGSYNKVSIFHFYLSNPRAFLFLMF